MLYLIIINGKLMLKLLIQKYLVDFIIVIMINLILYGIIHLFQDILIDLSDLTDEFTFFICNFSLLKN